LDAGGLSEYADRLILVQLVSSAAVLWLAADAGLIEYLPASGLQK